MYSFWDFQRLRTNHRFCRNPPTKNWILKSHPFFLAVLLLNRLIYGFSIPSAYPDGPDGPQIKVISGKSHGVESPVRPLGGCWYFHLRFKKPGTIFQAIRKEISLSHT